MKFEIKETYSFADLLLRPRHSDVTSRSEVDISVRIDDFTFATPVIPANMATITGYELILEMHQHKSLSILHRFMPIDHQIAMIQKLKADKGPEILNYVGFSIGVKKSDYSDLHQLFIHGAKIICIDIAHGDSERCLEMCRFIKKKHSNVLLIAGNVATGDGAARLWKAGADVIKCGIGGGKICSTRNETGNGVPQMSAIMEAYAVRKKLESKLNKKLYIISDGSIASAGDCVKALCFSDMVMIGGMFAGHDESAGEVVEMNGVKYKRYDGSSTHKTDHVEGVRSLTEIKGPVRNLMKQLSDGITSGCSYQGVRNLTDLKKNPEFVKISHAGLIESGTRAKIVI